jgi:hypothetical protein
VSINSLHQFPLHNTTQHFTMTRPENYQPQVRDTSTGPNLHTYIPRDDGSFTINGVRFLPQTGVATAATIPITSTGVPIPTPVSVQHEPYVLAGGPAILAFIPPLVQLTPQYYPIACHYFPLKSDANGFRYTASPFPCPYYQQASASEQTFFHCFLWSETPPHWNFTDSIINRSSLNRQ